MAAFTSILLGASLAVSAVGGYAQYTGARKQAAAQQQVMAAQQRQEQIRENQMRSEAERRRREIIRQSMRARSTALSTATAQGADTSTSLPGAYGGISGAFGTNTTAVNTNAAYGGQIFGENANIAVAQRAAAQGSSLASTGSSLMSLGGALQQYAPTISSIGASWFGGSNGTVGNTTGAFYAA